MLSSVLNMHGSACIASSRVYRIGPGYRVAREYNAVVLFGGCGTSSNVSVTIFHLKDCIYRLNCKDRAYSCIYSSKQVDQSNLNWFEPFSGHKVTLTFCNFKWMNDLVWSIPFGIESKQFHFKIRAIFHVRPIWCTISSFQFVAFHFAWGLGSYTRYHSVIGHSVSGACWW